jgi:hypothetical protein
MVMSKLENMEGSWTLEKASYYIYDHHNLSFPVDSIIIDRLEQLEQAPEFPFGIVFEKMDIANNKIICLFGIRRQNESYSFDGNIFTLLKEQTTVDTPEQQQIQQQSNQQQTIYYSSNVPESIETPNYTCWKEGKKLILIFNYSYGSSQYRFPVKGVLNLIYIKQ